MRHQPLDELDEQILKIVINNARIPFLEVARACNISGAAVHQRIRKLSDMGIIKGSNYIVDPEKMGYETCAFIGIYLKDPELFVDVVAALKKVPEVVECHYTTGKYAMFIKIYAKDNRHLLKLLLDKLATIPGVANTETFQLSLDEIFRRQLSTFGEDAD